MLKLKAAGLCLSLCMALVAADACAAPATDTSQMLLYRYVDNRGVTVLDRQGVPPEYAGKGYDILNERGRVVKTVPPAPTAEEIQRAQAAKVQAAADAQLLHLYSSVDDVDRAKARKLAELDALIAVANGNIQGLGAQQASLQGQAADQEHAGRVVPQTLIDQMNDIRDQQQSLKDDISRYQDARGQVDSSFAADRARVQTLLH